MRIGIPVALLFFVMLCIAAKAADLSGTWQADSKPQRVLKVKKTLHGYQGDFYDLGPEGAFTPRYNSVSRIILVPIRPGPQAAAE